MVSLQNFHLGPTCQQYIQLPTIVERAIILMPSDVACLYGILDPPFW